MTHRGSSREVRTQASFRTTVYGALLISVLMAGAMGLKAYWYRLRMGERESAAIKACKAYAGAQDIYRRADHDGDGVLEYATSVTGEGGLYAAMPNGVDRNPLAMAFVDACRSAGDPARRPFHGYYFMVLTGQGPNGPGGAKDYLVNGNMTIGYAVRAWPARYGIDGRNTFQLNNTGTVYQEDYGPDTAAKAETTTVYNPSLNSSAE